MRRSSQGLSTLHRRLSVSLILAGLVSGAACAVSGCGDDKSQLGPVENPNDPQVKHRGSMDYFVNKAREDAAGKKSKR